MIIKHTSLIHLISYLQLFVYDSSLTCLRPVKCRNYSTICSNSEFVFGLWYANDENNDDYESELGDYDDDNEDSDEQEEQYANRRIQVHHLDTLRTKFCLLVPKKYTIERIMADDDHVVAISRLDSMSRRWFMSIFELQSSAEKKLNKTARKFFLVDESHIDLKIETPFLFSTFLHNGWLVVALEDDLVDLREKREFVWFDISGRDNQELVWFDKSGKRSETNTRLKNTRSVLEIFPSGSSLLFVINRCKLLLKR